MFKLFRVAVALTIAELVSMGAPRPVIPQASAAGQSKKPKPPGTPKSEMMPMPIVAPLFVEDGTTHSEITMVNSLGLELSIDVVVFSPSGTEVARRKVTMEPRSQQKLKLGRSPSGFVRVCGRDLRIGFINSEQAVTAGGTIVNCKRRWVRT